MKQWSSRQIFALLLGVFVALGMSLSAVHASAMAVQMSTMADAGGSDQGGCDGCDGDKSPNAASCPSLLMCIGVVAVLPAASGLAVTRPAEIFFPASVLGSDLTAPPDPYPPRSLPLG